MLDRIDSILKQQCGVDGKTLLLVGVSGGPDSLCLMHMLHALGIPILVAHINHGLRPEAGTEAATVERFASQLGVNFISTRVDVLAYAAENSISIEESARRLRYQVLFEHAHAYDAVGVVVAHNADDQVETILMHLLRGSGLSGLRGMAFRTLPNPWSETIPLLRPLLTTSRTEIDQYLSDNGLIPIMDHSNLDTAFTRNRLRNSLLPILEGYNPRIRESLLQASQLMRDDYAFIQQFVEVAYYQIMVREEHEALAFRRSSFLEYSIPVQRYLLRKAMDHHLPGLRDVDYECIERGLCFLADEKTSGQIDLLAGMCLVKEGELFWVLKNPSAYPLGDFPMVPSGVQFTLDSTSTLDLGNGWQLQTEQIADPKDGYAACRANTDPFHAWLDIEGITLPLIVRSRLAGDRIRPTGMQGHSVKVSDLMVNCKLPKRARPTWPIVCSGQDILWIPGYRQSSLGQVKPESNQILHLFLVRLEPT